MLAIIPARGGSKGLPGKNIKNLCGKPLIEYTINAALQSESVERVFVSTDCSDIASIAMRAGAEVPFMRPDYLATDEAQAIETYLYTLDRLAADSIIPSNPDNVMILLPTCPLRTAADIDAANELFVNNQADSVVSYCAESHPVTWHQRISDDNRLVPIFEPTFANRQEAETTYFPNGSIFIFSTDLLKQRLYYSENSFAYVMPRNRSVDIDTIDDFLWAEYLLGVEK